MRKVKNLPQKINHLDCLEVRGELYGFTGHTKSQRLAAGVSEKLFSAIKLTLNLAKPSPLITISSVEYVCALA